MSISREEAMQSLRSMFPDWDVQTMSLLLASHGNHMERTIESILAMSDGPAVKAESLQQLRNADMPPPSAPKPFAAPSSASSRRRGISFDLPEDFLRAPGWKTAIIADEELAMMLQNQLFQMEVAQVMGDPFARRAPGSYRYPTPAAADTDLGIMKALSTMGAATKRQLSALAQKFSEGTKKVKEVGTQREFTPLVEHKDDEEDYEMVTFGASSRSQHILHRQEGEQEDFKEDYPTDRQHQQLASNPLLHTHHRKVLWADDPKKSV